MKYQFQIVGDQQYEYIMQEGEFDTPTEAIVAYKALKSIYRGEVPLGLPDKAWNAWIDNYLINGTGNSDLHSQMSPEQQKIIKAIQLSMKRIKRNPNEEEIE